MNEHDHTQRTLDSLTGQAENLVTPLRMVFWGALLCILDLSISQTTNGRGFRFDFLNDAIGTILIALGVFKLSNCQVHTQYQTLMTFVKVVSVLAVLDAIRHHFIVPLSSPIPLMINLFGIVKLLAVVSFCVAMRWVCEQRNLNGSANSWKLTTILFVIIYLVPLGLMQLISIFNIPFHMNLGFPGLLLLPIFLVPMIHLFISTSRMKSEATDPHSLVR